MTAKAEKVPVRLNIALDKIEITCITGKGMVHDMLNSRLTVRAFAEDPPDILIRPKVGGVLALDFRHADRLVEIGRQSVDPAAFAGVRKPVGGS